MKTLGIRETCICIRWMKSGVGSQGSNPEFRSDPSWDPLVFAGNDAPFLRVPLSDGRFMTCSRGGGQEWGGGQSDPPA